MKLIPSSAQDLVTVSALIAEHRDQPGALLPLLHAVQDALGHVPDDAVPEIARALNISRAEVHGVITYYHFFRREAPGRQVVQVCHVRKGGRRGGIREEERCRRAKRKARGGGVGPSNGVNRCSRPEARSAGATRGAGRGRQGRGPTAHAAR